MHKLRSLNQIACASCSVHYLCIAKDLSGCEMEELNSSISHFITVSKGEHLFRAQGPMQFLYAVQSGSCKDYRIDEKGNERIYNFYFPGDIIGLESIPKRSYFFSSIALQNSQFCVIPIDSLFALMQKHTAILKRVMDINSYKMQNDLQITTATNTHQRVANFILNIFNRLYERTKCEDHFILPMSQLEISQFLGMAYETVNRVIKNMVKEKIIKINYKKIFINDIDRLKELALSLTYFGQT